MVQFISQIVQFISRANLVLKFSNSEKATKIGAIHLLSIQIMKKIVQTKKRMGKDFKECQLEMAQANFAAKDFGVSVRDAVKTKTNVRLEVTCENVAGC